MRYKMAPALLYFLALVWFTYRLDGVPGWLAIVVIFVAPFLAGFAAGLWALPVPWLALLLALPAGYGSGEVPIWFLMMFCALIAIPAIVVGWAGRWILTRYAVR